MNCTQCQENLVAYLEDVLPEAEKQQVATHLQSCSTCSHEASEHARLRERLLADANALRSAPLDIPVMDRILREQTLRLRRRTTRRKYGLIGLGIAAAAALVAILVWPSSRGNGIAWADVVQQIEAARTAHLRLTMQDRQTADGKEAILTVYFKSPDKMRQEMPSSLVDSSDSDDVIIIVNGAWQAALFPAKKQYRMPVPQGYSDVEFTGPHFVQETLEDMGLLAAPPETTEQARHTVPGWPGFQLIGQATQQRGGRELLKYHLRYHAGDQSEPDLARYFWFEPESRELALITLERRVDGVWVETVCLEVQFNVDLADELFSTEIPPGYTEMPEAAKPSESTPAQSNRQGS